MFNVAIDSNLRGCDIVALKVEDIAPSGYALDRVTVRQKKTGRPVAVRTDRAHPITSHLNPIERLWGVMHRNVTHNKYYASCTEFAATTIDCLLAEHQPAIGRENRHQMQRLVAGAAVVVRREVLPSIATRPSLSGQHAATEEVKQSMNRPGSMLFMTQRSQSAQEH
jgi:hypothetical protein